MFTKIFLSFALLLRFYWFAKSSILDTWLGSAYVSEYPVDLVPKLSIYKFKSYGYWIYVVWSLCN